jgi:hypothetical protein
MVVLDAALTDTGHVTHSTGQTTYKALDSIMERVTFVKRKNVFWGWKRFTLLSVWFVEAVELSVRINDSASLLQASTSWGYSRVTVFLF